MSEPITFRLTGFEQATEEVRAAAHVGVVAGLEAVGSRAQGMLVQNIKSPYNGMPPAVGATGWLGNKTFFTVTPEGMLTRMLLQAGAPADTYAAPVNYGARPHMPPVNALLPWVAMKFGIEDEKSAMKIAWAIAINQKKKGMQGRFMFDRAQAEIAPDAPSIIERQISVALREAGIGGDVATA